MEFAIDSYDWVMGLNVFSMAMYADPSMTTKPYISGSGYYLRMSEVSRGYDSSGFDKWDKIFRSFVKKHKKKLEKIPRMKMMIKSMKL